MTDIIDFRIQPPYGSFGSIHFFRERDPDPDVVTATPFVLDREPMPSFDQFSMQLFEQEMERAGIRHAVVMGQKASAEYGCVDNADIARLAADAPQKYTGFAGIDASSPDAMDDLEAAVASGCRGISVIPGWSVEPHHEDAPRLTPVLRECAARGLPVVFTSSHYIGPDMSWSQPHFVQRAALAHPDLTIIVGHASWPWTVAVCALAMRCPNVYLMPEFYMYLPNMPGARDYVDAANGFLKHRFLYSSCYPSRSLEQALREFDELGLSPASRKLMLHDNAARVLGW